MATQGQGQNQNQNQNPQVNREVKIANLPDGPAYVHCANECLIWTIDLGGNALSAFSPLHHKEFELTSNYDGVPRTSWKFYLNVEHNENINLRYRCQVHNDYDEIPKDAHLRPALYHELFFTVEGMDYTHETGYLDCKHNNFEVNVPVFGITKRELRITLRVVVYHFDESLPKLKTILGAMNNQFKMFARNNNLQFLATGEYADVIVEAKDGKKFRAHKVILAAGSTEFAHKLRSPRVIETGIVKCNELEAKEVMFLLHFIYSGEVLPFFVGDQVPAERVEGVEYLTLPEILKVANIFKLFNILEYFSRNLDKLCYFRNAMHLLALCEKYKFVEAKKKIRHFMKTRTTVFEDQVTKKAKYLAGKL